MAQTPPYFNSNEAKGQDANCRFSEDFEEADANGGHWYGLSADDANAQSGIYVETKGWAGYNTADPTGGHVANEGIGGGYCGTHGAVNNPPSGGGNNMADHGFSVNGTDAVDLTELYVRWYQKWLSGYIYAQEKVLTFNHTSPGNGGIKWGNVHINQGLGTPSSTQKNIGWQGIDGNGVTESQDTWGAITTGNWMCLEVRIKLSTTTSSADGILQAWMDDCGTDGLTHGESQTLVQDDQARNFHRQNSGQQLRTLWWENWANSSFGGSTGTSYIDQIIVSTAPIGFFATSSATAVKSERIISFGGSRRRVLFR